MVPELDRRGSDEKFEPAKHDAQKRQGPNPENPPPVKQINQNQTNRIASSDFAHENEPGRDKDSSDDGMKHEPISEKEADR